MSDEITQDPMAELIALRRTLAAAKCGLPEALAARLQGESREEIEADAAQLAEVAKQLAQPSAPNPRLSPGNSGDTVSAPTMADRIRERINGGISPFFDPAFHRAKGGGPKDDSR